MLPLSLSNPGHPAFQKFRSSVGTASRGTRVAVEIAEEHRRGCSSAGVAGIAHGLLGPANQVQKKRESTTQGRDEADHLEANGHEEWLSECHARSRVQQGCVTSVATSRLTLRLRTPLRIQHSQPPDAARNRNAHPVPSGPIPYLNNTGSSGTASTQMRDVPVVTDRRRYHRGGPEGSGGGDQSYYDLRQEHSQGGRNSDARNFWWERNRPPRPWISSGSWPSSCRTVGWWSILTWAAASTLSTRSGRPNRYGS